MRSEASSDVLKVWLYAMASVLLGAWFAPLLYNAGKALAEVSSSKLTNGPLEWLAGICRATEFPGFFETSLLFAAGLLFLPFISSLRGGRATERGISGQLHLPEGARTPSGGQRLLANPRALRQGVTGFLLVTVLFLLIAGVLGSTGILAWKSPGENRAMLVLRGLAVAWALAAFQEFIFRGIAMGIFLRAMRPAAALGMSALLFALVIFLLPPAGMNVPDPDAAGVGFELLRQIAGLFAEPHSLLGSFTPLLTLGVVLGYARWRTASLSLPIGLHAGWIFVNGFLGSVTMATTRPDAISWVISGSALRQGLVPLVGIVIAGVLANYLTTEESASNDGEA